MVKEVKPPIQSGPKTRLSREQKTRSHSPPQKKAGKEAVLPEQVPHANIFSGVMVELLNKVKKIHDDGTNEKPRVFLTTDKPKVFFVVGGPGSGKGTQCFSLKKRYLFEHLSTGDLLRAEVHSGSKKGAELQKIMSEGGLVPTKELLGLIRTAMEQKGWAKSTFLLDGFPRNKENIDSFKKNLQNDVELLGTLFFELDKETMKKRCLGRNQGRADDNEKTIKKRLQTYITETLPVINNMKDGVYKINAKQAIDKVSTQTCGYIDQILKKNNDAILANDKPTICKREPLPIYEPPVMIAEIKPQMQGGPSTFYPSSQQTRSPSPQYKKGGKEAVHPEQIPHANIFSGVMAELLNKVKKTQVDGTKRQPNVLFVVGGPGSGKGTQCSQLKEKYLFEHLSTGDLLRAEVKSGSKTGAKLQKIMSEGGLVPTIELLGLLRTAMEQKGWADTNFLVDGFPRNQENIDSFKKNLQPDVQLLGTLFFELDKETMKERCMSRNEGRADDNIKTIKKRLRTYITETLPVIKNLDSVFKINARKDIDKVYDQTCGIVTKIFKKNNIYLLERGKQQIVEVNKLPEIPMGFVTPGVQVGKELPTKELILAPNLVATNPKSQIEGGPDTRGSTP